MCVVCETHRQNSWTSETEREETTMDYFWSNCLVFQKLLASKGELTKCSICQHATRWTDDVDGNLWVLQWHLVRDSVPPRAPLASVEKWTALATSRTIHCVPWQLVNIHCVMFMHHCGFTKHRLCNNVFITESPAWKQQDLCTIWTQICIFYVVCHWYIGNVAVFSTCWTWGLCYVSCQLRGNGECVCNKLSVCVCVYVCVCIHVCL